MLIPLTKEDLIKHSCARAYIYIYRERERERERERFQNQCKKA